jgi:hypothetical protein
MLQGQLPGGYVCDGTTCERVCCSGCQQVSQWRLQQASWLGPDRGVQLKVVSQCRHMQASRLTMTSWHVSFCVYTCVLRSMLHNVRCCAQAYCTACTLRCQKRTQSMPSSCAGQARLQHVLSALCGHVWDHICNILEASHPVFKKFTKAPLQAQPAGWDVGNCRREVQLAQACSTTQLHTCAAAMQQTSAHP